MKDKHNYNYIYQIEKKARSHAIRVFSLFIEKYFKKLKKKCVAKPFSILFSFKLSFHPSFRFRDASNILIRSFKVEIYKFGIGSFKHRSYALK